jgi:hypothetical protein
MFQSSAKEAVEASNEVAHPTNASNLIAIAMMASQGPLH